MPYLTISRNLSGDKINYIARDPYGIVRLRARTLKKLEKMIREYQPPKPEEIKEELKERGAEVPLPKIPAVLAISEEEKKEAKEEKSKTPKRRKRKTPPKAGLTASGRKKSSQGDKQK